MTPEIIMAPEAMWPLGTNMVQTPGISMSLMAPGATDSNKDPGCSRAIDPDMALSSGCSLNDTMARIWVDVHGICHHQGSCGCPGSGPPPGAVLGAESHSTAWMMLTWGPWLLLRAMFGSLSFHHVSSQTQVIRLGERYLYQLSHLAVSH